MRFLVDAQLPRRFCAWLSIDDHEAKHTLDLPKGNLTSDSEILDIAERENWIVVTKDDDFVQSFLVNGRPAKLLLVSTGNISNAELEKLIQANLKTIAKEFEKFRFVEIGRDILAVHQ